MNKKQIVLWCIFLFVGLVVLYFASIINPSPRLYHLFALSAIYALVALALKIAMGDGGVVFLGPTVPMGIAGYIVAKAATAKMGVGLTLLIAPIGATIICLLIFLPMLRASGLFFGMAAFAAAIVFESALKLARGFTGGPDGLTTIMEGDPIGMDLIPFLGSYPMRYAFVAFIILWMSLFLLKLWSSRTSKLEILATRDDVPLAQSKGVHTEFRRVQVLTVAIALCSVAGTLMAGLIGHVSPDLFTYHETIRFVSMPLLGGIETLVGPPIGAFLVISLPEFLREAGRYLYIFYGLAIIVIAVAFREGLMGLVTRLLSKSTPKAHVAIPDVIIPKCNLKQGETVLSCTGVSVHFGGLVAIDDVTLEIKSGEILGLIGPNGAGKTTLINVVTGFIKPMKGSVFIKGVKVNNESIRARVERGLARSFQGGRLFNEISTVENIKVGKGTAWINPALITDISPSELSYGDRLVLSVVSTVRDCSAIYLFDEPLAGLSEMESLEIENIFREIRKSGAGVLLVEHNFAAIRRLCDRVICIDHGAVIAEGTVEEVASNPQVQEAYLGKVQK